MSGIDFDPQQLHAAARDLSREAADELAELQAQAPNLAPSAFGIAHTGRGQTIVDLLEKIHRDNALTLEYLHAVGDAISHQVTAHEEGDKENARNFRG